MTSVSSLGSTLTQYQSPLSSLDKNGDGVISADELAAASQASTSSKAATDSDSDDKSSDVVKKIKNPTGLVGTLRRLPNVLAVAPMVTGDAISTYGTAALNWLGDRFAGKAPTPNC